MLLANGKWQHDHIPLSLPCGKKINEKWRPGLPVQCCRTECPDKSHRAINDCHRENKRLHRRPEFEPKEGV